MNNNEWYEGAGWYAPLEEARPTEKPAVKPEPQEEKEKPRGLTALRVSGGILILLALIVSSSLIFATPTSAPPSVKASLPVSFPTPSPSASATLPIDPSQFFSSYYTTVQSDTAEYDLERVELPIDYEQTLVPASGDELTLQELYERCSPSIVSVTGMQDGLAGYVWGTGVILSEDGLILTNAHVIEDCFAVEVMLSDDRSFEAKLVGADTTSDLALLKIEAEDLPAAELGESATLQVGDRVAAIGNPLGVEFRNTLTDGIISAIDRSVTSKGRSMTLIQTNTAINEGNSGGALFNMYGQVIGVTNMKMMSSYSSIEGIGFAIPSATVRSVVNSLVEYGIVRGRPSIGITVGSIPASAQKEYGYPEGLYISDVKEGTDAEAKGVRIGDVLTAVNGVAVSTTAEVNAIKNEFQAGDSLTLTLWREGETFDVEILLLDTNDVYG